MTIRQAYPHARNFCDDIDAVGITCPTQQHIDLIEMAAKAGRHCFVEKPFTRTLEEAERAVKAAETYGVQIMPAYNLRYTSAFQKMKEIVDSGKLGKLYQVRRRHGHDIYHKLNYDAQAIMNDPSWPWVDPIGEGRDPLYHAGSHAILWMLWMFGMPRSVSAVGSNIVKDLPVNEWQAIPGLTSDLQPKGIGSSSAWPFFEALAEGREVPVSVYNGRDCMMVLDAAERSAQEKREIIIPVN